MRSSCPERRDDSAHPSEDEPRVAGKAGLEVLQAIPLVDHISTCTRTLDQAAQNGLKDDRRQGAAMQRTCKDGLCLNSLRLSGLEKGAV